MPLGVRIETLWCPITGDGAGWRGYYRISPGRQRIKWQRWVAWCFVRREEGTSVMWVTCKLLLHEGSSSQLHVLPVGGHRSVGQRRCAAFNSGVTCNKQIKCKSFCLVFFLSLKASLWSILSSSPLPCFCSGIHSKLCRVMINQWGSLGSASLLNPLTKSNK